jgi:hypothetical protein
VLMVNRYADDAEANADRRADELETEGDHAGAAIWCRVTVAIEQLTDDRIAYHELSGTRGLPNHDPRGDLYFPSDARNSRIVDYTKAFQVTSISSCPEPHC